MKSSIFVPLVCCAFSGSALAADMIDVATVVSTTPRYAPNPPKRVCYEVQQQGSADTSITGVVIGGVAGGLLGNQVGKGSGKTAATAVGAVAGALVGNNLANNQAGARPAQQQCEMVKDGSQRIVGYNVTYAYAGKTATVRMSRPPGETIRVGVSALQQ